LRTASLIDRYLARAIATPLLATLVIAAMLLVLDKMLRLFDFVAAQKGASELFDVTPLPPGASAEVYTDALAKSGGLGAPRQADLSRSERSERGGVWGEAPSNGRPSLVICAGDGRASLLALKPGVDLSKHPILGKRVAALRTTDVALLHMGILEPVLGITPEEMVFSDAGEISASGKLSVAGSSW
jgi:hypothetical protein